MEGKSPENAKLNYDFVFSIRRGFTRISFLTVGYFYAMPYPAIKWVKIK
jgi:hypothetical protein